MEVFVGTLKHSLMITAFVLLMMVVIDYINVQSKNVWADRLRNSPLMQILIAAFLGITPGCMGAFTIVSLYTHRMVGLAALVTVMIATSGDEAFVMFALFPGKALVLHLILFSIAVVVGWLVYLFSNQRKNSIEPQHGFKIHEHELCICFDKKGIVPQIRHITFERFILLLGVVIFTVLLVLGVIGTKAWDWKKITFLTGSLFMLFVLVTVPEHFLKDHLYDHVIKKHLLRILLWSWGAFVVLHFVQTNNVMTGLVENNQFIVLIVAVLVGIIPESGPHLVFVTLFSQGLIPFSILLASSISQDGHGMLPLLAESRKAFVKVKIINVIVAFSVGALLILLGM